MATIANWAAGEFGEALKVVKSTSILGIFVSFRFHQVGQSHVARSRTLCLFLFLLLLTVESDPNPALVEKYDVYGLPTLYVFKDGAPVKDKWEGIITKDKLKEWLAERGV